MRAPASPATGYSAAQRRCTTGCAVGDAGVQDRRRATHLGGDVQPVAAAGWITGGIRRSRFAVAGSIVWVTVVAICCNSSRKCVQPKVPPTRLAASFRKPGLI